MSLYSEDEIRSVMEKEGCDYQEAQRIMAHNDGYITVWTEDLVPGDLFVNNNDGSNQFMFWKKTKNNLRLMAPNGKVFSTWMLDPKTYRVIKVSRKEK